MKKDNDLSRTLPQFHNLLLITPDLQGDIDLYAQGRIEIQPRKNILQGKDHDRFSGELVLKVCPVGSPKPLSIDTSLIYIRNWKVRRLNQKNKCEGIYNPNLILSRIVHYYVFLKSSLSNLSHLKMSYVLIHQFIAKALRANTLAVLSWIMRAYVYNTHLSVAVDVHVHSWLRSIVHFDFYAHTLSLHISNVKYRKCDLEV